MLKCHWISLFLLILMWTRFTFPWHNAGIWGYNSRSTKVGLTRRCLPVASKQNQNSWWSRGQEINTFWHSPETCNCIPALDSKDQKLCAPNCNVNLMCLMISLNGLPNWLSHVMNYFLNMKNSCLFVNLCNEGSLICSVNCCCYGCWYKEKLCWNTDQNLKEQAKTKWNQQLVNTERIKHQKDN